MTPDKALSFSQSAQHLYQIGPARRNHVSRAHQVRVLGVDLWVGRQESILAQQLYCREVSGSQIATVSACLGYNAGLILSRGQLDALDLAALNALK